MADKREIQAESKLDHYNFWEAHRGQDKKALDLPKKLHGQLDDKTPVTVTVHDLKFIGNPVHKNQKAGAKYLHENLHFLMYEIQDGKPPKIPWVQVFNQFLGKEAWWQLGALEYLLVYAAKQLTEKRKSRRSPSL
jgi:hypothetical protein